MSIYKRYFVKTKSMYVMIKDENFFDKYIKIWEKDSNIIKKINSELIHNKQYLEAKKIIRKEIFYRFYKPVILINSVYRKDKVFLEKFHHKFF